MAFTEEIRVNIEQVKQAFAELEALGSTVEFAPNVPLNTAALALPSTELTTNLESGEAITSQSLNDLARLQGAGLAAIEQFKAAAVAGGDTSFLAAPLVGPGGQYGPYQSPYQQLRQPYLNVVPGGELPPLSARAAGRYDPFTEATGLEQADIRAAQREASNARKTVNAEYQVAAQQEAEATQQAAAATSESAKKKTAQSSLEDSALRTQEEIDELLLEQAAALRASIIKYEAALGQPITQGPAEGATIQELIAAKTELSQLVRLDVATQKQQLEADIKLLAKTIERQANLSGVGPGTYAPTQYLQGAARAEGVDAAAERSIAVAYGEAKQEAYLTQIEYNQVFRQQFAQEAAYRQARLGIESQLTEAELARPAYGGGTLNDAVVGGKVATKVGDATRDADTATLLAANKTYTDALTEEAVAHAKQTAIVNEGTRVTAGYVEAKQDAAVTAAREAAEIATGLAANPAYIEAKVQATEAKLAERAAIIEETDITQVLLTAKVQASEAIIQSQIKAAESEILHTQENAILEAQRQIALKEYNVAVAKATAAQLEAAGASQFAVAQAAAGKFSTSASSADSVGGALGGGIFNTLKFAGPSLLAFGAIGGLASSLKEAEALEKQFLILTDQAKALGKEGDLPALKEGILDIAASSGTASDKVAELAIRFQAAFGGDVQQSLAATQAAIEAVKITGLSVDEVVTVYRTLTEAFGNSSTDMRTLTDNAVGLEKTFGVAAGSILQFSAALAPVAAEAGFTVNQVEALGATIEKASSKSGTAAADSLNRIIPSIQAQAVGIIGLFDKIGKTEVGQQLADSFAKGDIPTVLELLQANFKNLDNVSKSTLDNLIARPRDQAALAALLNNPNEYQTALQAEDSGAFKDAGQQRYDEIQKSLSQRLAQLGETFKQVGISLFNGGLGEGLNEIASIGKVVLDVLGQMISVAGALNSALGGIPVTLLTAVLGFKALVGIYGVMGNAVNFLTGAKATETIVTDKSTASEIENAGARGVNSSAAEVEALSIETAETSKLRGLGARFAGPGTRIGGFASTVREGYAAREASSAATSVVDFGAAEEGVVLASGSKLAKVGTIAEKTASGLGAFTDAIPAPLAIAAAGLALVTLITTVNNLRDSADKVLADVNSKILNERDPQKQQAELDALRAQESGLTNYDRLSFAVSGLPTPADQAGQLQAQINLGGNIGGLQALQNRISSSPTRDALSIISDAGFEGGDAAALAGGGDQLKDIIDKAKNGDPEAAKKAQDILNKLHDANKDLYEKEIQPQIDAARLAADAAKVTQQTTDDLKAKAKTDTEQVQQTVSTIKSGISTGEISVAQGLSIIQSQLQVFEQLTAKDPKALDQKQAAAYQDFKKAQAEIISGQILGAAELANKLQSTTGEDPEAALKNLTSALQDPRLTAADRKKGGDELLAAYKAYYDFRLKNAKTQEEALGIINGTDSRLALDVGAQEALLVEEINSSRSFTQFSQNQSADVQAAIAGVGQQIAHIMANSDVNLAEATREALLADAAVKRQLLKTIQAAGDNVDALKAAGLSGDLGERDRKVKDLQSQIDSDENGARAVVNNGDQIKDVEKAKQYKKSKEERDAETAKVIKDNAQARAELAKAYAAGDSVTIAAIDVQLAQQDLLAAEQTGITADIEKAQAKVVAANYSLRQATIARGQARFALLKANDAGDPVAQANDDVRAAEYAVANSTADNIDQNRAGLRNAQEAAKKAGEARSDAYAAYVEQLFSDDPVAAAKIAVQHAQEVLARAKPGTAEYFNAAKELNSLQKQAEKAGEQLDLARLDYAAAQVSGDPVKAAQAAKVKADYELAHAKTEEEKLKALTAELAADRSIQNAMEGVFTAQQELLKAAANYAGDTVGAAHIGVVEAQKALEEVQAKFARGDAGQAQVDGAKAALINAQGAQRSAIISQRESDLDFQFQMKQITVSQYIQYLEQLKSTADGNQNIIHDLDLKIKGLKDQLGAELQFNLPTNLGLPTLYEARRLNQSSGPGGAPAGYQDNRQVQINLIVNNGMDVTNMKNILSDALGGRRNGNDLRSY